MQRKFVRVIAYCFLVLLLGCGRRTNEPPLADVAGKVTYKGQPLKSGKIQFSHDLGRPYSQDLGPDGTYKMKAGVGHCKVTVEAREAGASIKDRPGMSAPGKSLIPDKYMSTGKSGLTFDVKPGSNQADFDLK